MASLRLHLHGNGGNLAGHLGLLKGWTPWAVAATPSLIYLALSLAAFGWLVRYR